MTPRAQVAELVQSGMSFTQAAFCLNMTKNQVSGYWYRYLASGDFQPSPPRTCRLCDRKIARKNISDLCGYHRVEQRKGRIGQIATPIQTTKPVDARYLLSDIIELSAEVFGVSVEDVQNSCRKQHLVAPRQCIALLAKALTALSYPQIGVVMGKDHSTILYSHRVGQWRFVNEPEFCNQVLAVLVRMEPVRLKSRHVVAKAKPRPLRAAKVLPFKPRPEPEPEPELDDMAALSLAVQRHYAAGRDCLETY